MDLLGMLDSSGNWHTLIICNIHCFSKATVVTWTHHSVMFICMLPIFVPSVLLYMGHTKTFEDQQCSYSKGFLVDATGCAWSNLLWAKLSKQFTPHHNVGLQGCVRFLFPLYFLLSVPSVALYAVISTLLLCITHLHHHSAMYLQQ